ncbi:MAG TPA: N-6 DNA methylase [Chitinispirillaceae bacterium]|nr:N-6 DNA methylase [Chitinispirillaceae bacterium]
MLDIDTRRRIDSARDILVGKVPDPKAQVEQITTALVYKFMDDMDKESVELGGKAQFFKNGYAHYAWSKLMDSRLGGHERLALYGESITKMAENPNIPQLFRNIFKDAFLPYRDPETLNLFLKEINGFIYDHSERLGDAYEYLLSVLGSQGDAGQFRTPRHIIDFIVKVVDPDKAETILDPACGTAGFLISAFKHILGKYQKNKPGDLMTPAERKKFMGNFAGYDISPDMVRISLVNMYLHSFPDPSIVEYDTLTSEEKWDELYDCVLANPPFMTPKGGIRPHKRFSVQASRSEVLFVDYIMEHLTKDGRAGVIVPEGIIFQSQTAYKELRRKLVEENYLYAVVSLPAGVFNPYSGVKTSILLMDRKIARERDEILFVKVENDGFDLGAQRREIEKNDLPESLKSIQYWRARKEHPYKIAHAVHKKRIAENGDFVLSGERYRVVNISENGKWPFVPLSEFAEVINGRAYKESELLDDGPVPVLRVGNFFSNRGWYYSNLELPEKNYCDKGDLLYAWSASFGPKIWDGPRAIYHYHIWKIVPNEKIDKHFLYYLLQWDTENIKAEGGRGIAMLHITKSGIEKRKFPLPPLEIQQQIVAELSQYQKVIDGARMVVENYRPYIKVEEDWKRVELGNICDVRDGTHDSPKYKQSGIPLITSKNLKNGTIDFSEVNLISQTDFENISKRSGVDDGDILMPMIGTIGNPVIVKKERDFAIKNVALIKFNKDSQILNTFLQLILSSAEYNSHFQAFSKGATQKFIPLGFIRKLMVPLPPKALQKQIVAFIQTEQAVVAHNKVLLEQMQARINTKLAEIWGDPS